MVVVYRFFGRNGRIAPTRREHTPWRGNFFGDRAGVRMLTSNAAYLRYWGKERPVEGASTTWHPLAFHMLDVAAVARAINSQRGRAASSNRDTVALRT
jgi:hypothetical protein